MEGETQQEAQKKPGLSGVWGKALHTGLSGSQCSGPAGEVQAALGQLSCGAEGSRLLSGPFHQVM